MIHRMVCNLFCAQTMALVFCHCRVQHSFSFFTGFYIHKQAYLAHVHQLWNGNTNVGWAMIYQIRNFKKCFFPFFMAYFHTIKKNIPSTRVLFKTFANTINFVPCHKLGCFCASRKNGFLNL